MAYVSKQWKDRLVEYPNRRTITHDDLTQEVVSVNRNEGTIYEAGDVLDSVNMNNLESRIAAGFNEKQNTLTAGSGITIVNDVISATGGGGGGAVIDDTTTALDKTWSSSKISSELSGKQNTLTAGSGISISNDVISATGGGGASALDDLTDVDITTPSNGDVLKYNATAQKWENGTGGGGGSQEAPNLIFGGDDLRGKFVPPNFTTSMPFAAWNGFIINENLYTNLEIGCVPGYYMTFDTSKNHILKMIIKVGSQGVFYHEIELVAGQLPQIQVSFTLGGVNFTIYRLNLSADSLSIQLLRSDTSTDSFLQAISLQEVSPAIPDFPFNNENAQMMTLLSKKLGYTDLTGTLTAGNTSLTISDASITTSSTIDVYTDMFGINPTNLAVSTGSVTLTFAALQADLGVKVRVS